jgi:hypothetical protein
MPTARAAPGAAAFAGRIHVAGGETPQLFDVHEVYDPEENQWTTATDMPVPRHGIAAVTLDEGVLFPGGGLVQGLDPASHVDKFVPAAPPPVPALSITALAALGAGLLLSGSLVFGRTPRPSKQPNRE